MVEPMVSAVLRDNPIGAPRDCSRRFSEVNFMFNSPIVHGSGKLRAKAEYPAEDNKDFTKRRGQRIRHAARLRGLEKSVALAAALNVSPATVSKWQNGGKISLESVCNIAYTLDISTDWLLLGRGWAEGHRSRTYCDPELDLVRRLRRLPARVQELIRQLVAELPPEESLPGG